MRADRTTTFYSNYLYIFVIKILFLFLSVLVPESERRLQEEKNLVWNIEDYVCNTWLLW